MAVVCPRVAALALCFGIAFTGVRALGQTNSEFSVQINDGLGRPVPGVAVDVFRIQKHTNAPDEKIELGNAVSGDDGIARSTYTKSSIPTNESFSVALSKAGYAGYMAAPQVTYILKRLFHAPDVDRILKLPIDAQRRELRELLAGTMDPAGPSLDETIFSMQSHARPTLRWLLDDAQVGAEAGELLAFIGNPDDVRLLIQYAPQPSEDPAIDHWTYAVASALLKPTSEREWSFLKHCAADDYGDHWVDTAGIRTLRLMASARSLQMLEDERLLNPGRSNEINAAIAYINSKPAPLTATDPANLAEKVAQALGAGSWMGNEQPRFDDQHTGALVDCNFLVGGIQFVVFTVTLHQDAGLWHVQGVRQTRQNLLPRKPSPSTTARAPK